MNIYDIDEKITNAEALSMKEVYYFLDHLNNTIITNSNLNDTNIMQCMEISGDIYNRYTTNFDMDDVRPFDTNDLGIHELVHYSTFIKFKTNEGYKWFIVDPTAIQFDTDKYPLGLERYIDIKNNLNNNQKMLLEDFKTKGYTELTSRSLIDYTNIFIKALKNNGYDINILEANNKLTCFCIKSGITFGNDSLSEPEKNKKK